jgi:DNA uptake protein ComE-like DNA-binding protein
MPQPIEILRSAIADRIDPASLPQLTSFSVQSRVVEILAHMQSQTYTGSRFYPAEQRIKPVAPVALIEEGIIPQAEYDLFLSTYSSQLFDATIKTDGLITEITPELKQLVRVTKSLGIISATTYGKLLSRLSFDLLKAANQAAGLTGDSLQYIDLPDRTEQVTDLSYAEWIEQNSIPPEIDAYFSAMVSLGTATVAELKVLPSIGSVTAQAIVTERLNAPFSEADPIGDAKSRATLSGLSWNQFEALLTL